MNTIINPTTGEHFSLFSTQGKNLLKSFVKTFQRGGMMKAEEEILVEAESLDYKNNNDIEEIDEESMPYDHENVMDLSSVNINKPDTTVRLGQLNGRIKMLYTLNNELQKRENLGKLPKNKLLTELNALNKEFNALKEVEKNSSSDKQYEAVDLSLKKLEENTKIIEKKYAKIFEFLGVIKNNTKNIPLVKQEKFKQNAKKYLKKLLDEDTSDNVAIRIFMQLVKDSSPENKRQEELLRANIKAANQARDALSERNLQNINKQLNTQIRNKTVEEAKQQIERLNIEEEKKRIAQRLIKGTITLEEAGKKIALLSHTSKNLQGKHRNTVPVKKTGRFDSVRLSPSENIPLPDVSWPKGPPYCNEGAECCAKKFPLDKTTCAGPNNETPAGDQCDNKKIGISGNLENCQTRPSLANKIKEKKFMQGKEQTGLDDININIDSD